MRNYSVFANELCKQTVGKFQHININCILYTNNEKLEIKFLNVYALYNSSKNQNYKSNNCNYITTVTNMMAMAQTTLSC